MFRRRVFTWAAENIVSYFDCCVIRPHSTSPIAIWLDGGRIQGFCFHMRVSICLGRFCLAREVRKKSDASSPPLSYCATPPHVIQRLVFDVANSHALVLKSASPKKRPILRHVRTYSFPPNVVALYFVPQIPAEVSFLFSYILLFACVSPFQGSPKIVAFPVCPSH